MVKASEIATALAIIALLWIGGAICAASGILGNNPPVDTGFVFQVLVIDENGTLVPGEKVYFVSCLEEPAGWTTQARYVCNDSKYGYTGSNESHGFVELYSINYTLTKNDVVWLGASTNESLLISDYASKTFDSGGIGRWVRVEYDDVSHFSDQGWKHGYTIMIRNSDGRMIETSSFTQEYGPLLSPIRPIDYFWYMDNHS